MNIEALLKPVLEEARILGLLQGRHAAGGSLTATEKVTLESSAALLARRTVELITAIKVETAGEVSEALAEQERAAFSYITALVIKAGGSVDLSGAELAEVDEYQLERAEPGDGLILRAFKPQGAQAIDVPPKRDIILPEGLH